MTTISATEFRKRCFKLMGQVHHLRSKIVVTKRGKPWVEIIPCGEEEPHVLLGCIPDSGKSVTDLPKPIPESWEADQLCREGR